MKLVMVGAGYVGLVSGVCFAEAGHEVTCVDIDENKIERLRNGDIPIYEPGLEDLVLRNIEHNRLYFESDPSHSVPFADAVFICVGTPSRSDGGVDLGYVRAAVKDVASKLHGYTVIVNKSTVPVGTGDEIEQLIAAERSDADFDVVSNPEFLREGAAITDFQAPDRIVVGIDNERARPVMEAIYLPWTQKGAPLVVTERRSAEIIKYAANAFLAMKITFINQIADLCEAASGNVEDVVVGVGLDNRIGERFLKAGPGFGGSCFPKDTRALAEIGATFGARQELVETTIAVNEERKRAMARRVVEACGGSVTGKAIGLWGLTFKPGTDDMRESPSIDIANQLITQGAVVSAFDPEGMGVAASLLPDVRMCRDLYGPATSADCLVLITEWDEFLTADLGRIRQLMRIPCIVDLRNAFEDDYVSQHGIYYYSLGKTIANKSAKGMATCA